MPWRREWLPTLVFLPGEFYGQGSLAGYSPWGRKESDTTERLTTNTSLHQFVILVPCHVLVFAPMLRFSSLYFCLSRQHRTSVAVLFSTEIFEPFGFPFQRQKVSDGL